MIRVTKDAPLGEDAEALANEIISEILGRGIDPNTVTIQKVEFAVSSECSLIVPVQLQVTRIKELP